MNFKLSGHAEKELERRKIPRAYIDVVLNSPQQIVPEKEGRNAYQSKLDFGGKVYLVRAIVKENEPAMVVTVYRTSKIDKYWRSE